MAWTTPLTAVANATLTAAQWNASVRDNLLETPAAKATTAGSYFVTSAANTVVERQVIDGTVETAQTTVSTTYAALTTAGPAATVTSGVLAFVFINADCANSLANTGTYAAFEVTGATTSAAIDGRAVKVENAANSAVSAARTTLFATTPGSNTFNMLYRVLAGTGTIQRRRIQVMAL